MFARVSLVTSVNVFNGAKIFSVTSQRNYKVTVIGASGGIGQPLSLLLKMNNLVSHLSLYDISPITPGVAVDLSHINTACRVTGHKGPDQLGDALMCASVVVIPAGVPRKPGMKREDLFKVNAGLIRDMSKAIAKYCPQAIIAIITNPVNSMVPIAAEVLKLEGVYDPRRIMGVTTLDVVRACTFIAEINKIDPKDVTVPVVGGHSGPTIIPLFSQSNPPVQLYSCHQVYKLTEKVQEAGTTVVKAKGGGGSATLSMAFSGARFTASILRGLAGEQNVVECAYVPSGFYEPAYFANPVLLGPCGMAKNFGYTCPNGFETQLLRIALPELLRNIQIGEDFAAAEGAYDPRRLMGVTTLDIVRACTFVGEINCIDPRCVSVSCIGGHSGETIIPVFSQCNPRVNLGTWAEMQKLTERVQEAGTAVVKAKGGGGSATLAMAFAGAKFTSSLLKGLAGEQNVIECAYVASGLCEPAYFANPVLLGQCGMVRNLGFNCLNPFEMQLLRKAMPELLKSIKMGEQFALKKD